MASLTTAASTDERCIPRTRCCVFIKADLPIACTLTPDELRRGREALLPGIIARAGFHEPDAGGYRIRFDQTDGLIPAIAAMIDSERRCCRFLQFTLTTEPAEGSVWLEVTGPPGTSDFLAGWLPAA
jgi:hypothetical protein